MFFLANEKCLWILLLQKVTKSSSRACTISQSHKICSMVSASLLQNVQVLVSLSFIFCKKEFVDKISKMVDSKLKPLEPCVLVHVSLKGRKKNVLLLSITYIEDLVPSEFPCWLFTISV